MSPFPLHNSTWIASRFPFQIKLHITIMSLSCILGFSLPCCFRSRPDRGEVIIFATVGNAPFLDYILTIRPNGSRLKPLLKPKTGRSYLGASGNSLRRHLLLGVHETNLVGKIEDHLYLYRPASGEWRRGTTQGGVEGFGTLCPDDVHVIFNLAPTAAPSQYSLWITDSRNWESRKLTMTEPGTWDDYPSCHPSGQDIAFLRLQITTKGVVTKLMRVASQGGEPVLLLGPEDGTAGVCYGPNGKQLAVLTNKGLEIIDAPAMTRTVILLWVQLPDHRLDFGTLSWSRTLNKLALALFNKQMHRHELWTISTDGTDPRCIYSVKEGTIGAVSFIET